MRLQWRRAGWHWKVGQEDRQRWDAVQVRVLQLSWTSLRGPLFEGGEGTPNSVFFFDARGRDQDTLARPRRDT